MYKKKEPVTAGSVSYKKADLQKIKWIAGKWKGMDDDKPFYEIYEFINDSTIKITNYELKEDSNDSTNSYIDNLFWQDGLYFLGANKDWATGLIEDSVIQLQPNSDRIHNDITWQLKTDGSWDAVLTSPKGVKIYHMQKAE